MKKLFIICALSLLLMDCQMFDENAPSDQCTGLKRQMTRTQNSNSYNRDVIESQQASLKKQYKALKCNN